jgi:penicillin-binding protein 1B
MGIGAAARVYYSKDAAQLDLGEAATLAGIIQAPNRYAPDRHPQDAGKRRDWVLGRRRELGWLSEERFELAMAAPTESRPQRVVVRRAPYFVDRTLRELEVRYGDIASQSALSVLTSLDWHDQQSAEAAVAWGMEAIEEGWERESGSAGDLQAALVSLDPHSGEIVSWVGGRDYQASQFDRASLAKRQAGSAFKPVVYAAAMKDGVITPATLLEDSPFAVREAGQEVWEPRNDSREFHGWVTVREAVESSLNVPTARVAMETGLDEIVETARQLGITTRLRPYPALALGAFEVTPQELAGVYATLASGGVRWPVHGVRAVISAGGNPLPTPELPQEERVLEPSVAYVLTSVLRGVVDRGTARVVRAQGFHDPLAGKTGTTDGRRDSWFAGYSPSRATLVWVGYDDNRETKLSGSRAALPIWSRFMWQVRPAGGFSDFARPPGVDTAAIDPETGLRANLACPEVRQEVFLEGQAPWRFCFLHGSGSRRARAEAREAAQESAIGGEVVDEKRSFWQRVFGKKKKKKKSGG